MNAYQRLAGLSISVEPDPDDRKCWSVCAVGAGAGVDLAGGIMEQEIANDIAAMARMKIAGVQTFASPLGIGDPVTIDGDRDLKARVIGVLFRHAGTQVEVAWLHNGDAKTSWIELFRLEPAEASNG